MRPKKIVRTSLSENATKVFFFMITEEEANTVIEKSKSTTITKYM